MRELHSGLLATCRKGFLFAFCPGIVQVMSGMGASESSRSPVRGCSIRVVAERTGLSLEVLRVWERRYGFPLPERRPGSNRRWYSEADVARLQRLARALEQGYRIGDVIALDPADLGALLGGSPERASEDAPSQDSILEALAADDLARMDQELSAAAQLLGPRRFVVELAHGLAITVGERWARGELSIRHEHALSQSLSTRLRRFLADASPTASTVLLTTLPGEPHSLALEMVAVVLGAAGIGARLLGPSTPVQQILGAARALHVRAVGLTITSVSSLRAAKSGAAKLAAGLGPGVELWLGGDAADRVATAVPRATVLSSWERIEHAAARL